MQTGRAGSDLPRTRPPDLPPGRRPGNPHALPWKPHGGQAAPHRSVTRGSAPVDVCRPAAPAPICHGQGRPICRQVAGTRDRSRNACQVAAMQSTGNLTAEPLRWRCRPLIKLRRPPWVDALRGGKRTAETPKSPQSASFTSAQLRRTVTFYAPHSHHENPITHEPPVTYQN